MLGSAHVTKNESDVQNLEHNKFADVTWAKVLEDTAKFFDPAKPDRVTVGPGQAGCYFLEAGWLSGVETKPDQVVYGWLIRSNAEVLAFRMIGRTQPQDNLLSFVTVSDLAEGDYLQLRLLAGHGQPVRTSPIAFGTFLKIGRIDEHKQPEPGPGPGPTPIPIPRSKSPYRHQDANLPDPIGLVLPQGGLVTPTSSYHQVL